MLYSFSLEFGLRIDFRVISIETRHGSGGGVQGLGVGAGVGV